MLGGATDGYCDTGSLVIDTAPSTMMNKAITHAKMGRSIKNLAMGLAPYFCSALAAAAGALAAGAAAAGAAAALPGACHGTAFTGVPGGIICSF